MYKKTKKLQQEFGEQLLSSITLQHEYAETESSQRTVRCLSILCIMFILMTILWKFTIMYFRETRIRFGFEITELIHTNSTVIEETKLIWHTTLYYLFIKPKYFEQIFILQEYLKPHEISLMNTLHGNDIDFIEKTKYPSKYHSVYTTNDFCDLCSTTFNMFLSVDKEMDIINQWKYKELLSIRRSAMIIHKYLSKNSIRKNETKICDDNSYLLLLQLLHKIMITFYPKDLYLHKKLFLIHVSKSAGTTICSTLRLMGYITPIKGTNCNLQYPFFGPLRQGINSRYSSCSELYDASNKYDIIAKESPMNITQICDEFIYIFPIREPLIHIFSWIYQANSELQSFLVRDDKNKEKCDKNGDGFSVKSIKKYNKKSSKSYCYRRPITAFDFKGFIKESFEGELVNQEINQQKFGDYSIQYFGKQKYSKYAWKSKAIAAQHNTGINTQNHELLLNINYLRGYMSNVYTRYIGYNNDNKKTNMYTVSNAYFAKSYEITLQHFLNSVHYMMKIDYILPFESKINHPIWSKLLNHIHQKVRGENDEQNNPANIFGWGHEAHSKKSPLSSKSLYNIMDDVEKRTLIEKNIFDIQLYDFAYWIADVDSDIND